MLELESEFASLFSRLNWTNKEGNRIVKFHNQSLRFILLPSASESTSLFPILDGCAAADFVLIGVSSEEEVNTQGETCLRCLTGTGVGATSGIMAVVQVRSPPLSPSFLHLALGQELMGIVATGNVDAILHHSRFTLFFSHSFLSHPRESFESRFQFRVLDGD